MMLAYTFPLTSSVPLPSANQVSDALAPWQPSQAAVLNAMASLAPPQAQQLMQAFQQSVTTKGKLIRPTLALLMLEALTHQPTCQLSAEDARVRLASVSELIHLATLLHDDVLDEADTRRGKPTVRFSLGNHTAILAGDFLLAKASQTLASLGHLEIVRIYSDVLAYLCDGELLQHELCFNREASTWERYEQKNNGKTGSLFAATLEAVGQWVGVAPEALTALHQSGLEFGMAFQLMDDVLDYTTDAATLGKPVLDDARHGIINAPLLFALEEAPTLVGDALQALFEAAQAQQPQTQPQMQPQVPYPTEALAQQLKTALLQTQALARTQTLAFELTQQALNRLASLLTPQAQQSRAFTALCHVMLANVQRRY